MEQLSENVVIISGGEPIPEGSEEAIKIALLGSSDLNPMGDGDWQYKFAKGLALITSTEPGKGIIMYKGMKFLVMNCKSWSPRVPVMSYDNVEFIQKISTDLDYAMASDCIFFNFHKKSQAVFPLLEFSNLVGSGKMVVRCSQEYGNYGFVRIMCERLQVPLLPGATTSVLTVLQTMSAFIPKFQELSKLRLPE